MLLGKVEEYSDLKPKASNSSSTFTLELASLTARIRAFNTLLGGHVAPNAPSQCLEGLDLPVLERQRQIHVYLPEYCDGKFDKLYFPQYSDGKFHKLLMFGPNYRAKEIMFWKDVKNETLDHVLNNSQSTLPELMNTMASIEGEARAAYAKDVLERTKQWMRPLELAKRTLHKFLIVGQQPKPVDLFHCLQSIMLGTKSGLVGTIPKMLDNIDGISSAWQLSEQGVQFKKLEGELGSRGIHYKRSTLDAVLYLPVFRVEMYTELIVKCLIKYEIVQEPRGINYKLLL